jgi:hypothetical protein
MIAIGQSDYNLSKQAYAAWNLDNRAVGTAPALTFAYQQSIQQYYNGGWMTPVETSSKVTVGTFLEGSRTSNDYLSSIGTNNGTIYNLYFSAPSSPVAGTNNLGQDQEITQLALSMDSSANALQYAAAFANGSIWYAQADLTPAQIRDSGSTVMNMLSTWNTDQAPNLVIGDDAGRVSVYQNGGSSWNYICSEGTAVLQLSSNATQIFAGFGDGTANILDPAGVKDEVTISDSSLSQGTPVYQLYGTNADGTVYPYAAVIGYMNGAIQGYNLSSTPGTSTLLAANNNFSLLDVNFTVDNEMVVATILAGFNDGSVSLYNDVGWTQLQPPTGNRVQYISANWSTYNAGTNTLEYVISRNFEFFYCNMTAVTAYPSFSASYVLPGASNAVTAVPGAGSATVSFMPPANTGGSPNTFYTATSSPGNKTARVKAGGISGVPMTVTVSGLTNGTAYTFKVNGMNEVGTGPASAVSNKVTPSTVPGKATNVAAIRGNGQATVFFTAPAATNSGPGNGGSPITSYSVTSDPEGITVTRAGSSASPITVSGLTYNIPYTFRVTATNANGSGVPSSPSIAVTPTAAVPGAPTTVTAVRDGSQTLSVSFTAASENGTEITGYTVTSQPGGIIGTGHKSPIRVSGLTNGTAYAFTVKATNGIGTGPASALSPLMIPAVVPAAPTTVTATAGILQATIAFKAPTSNGGMPITSYTLTSVTPAGITITKATSPIIVTGLRNLEYTFNITASNAVGTGASSSVSVTPKATNPGAPTGVNACSSSDISGGKIFVYFTPPQSDGGTAIWKYTATSYPGGITATGTASPIIASGLKNGTAYKFNVTATSGIESSPLPGPASAWSPYVTPATVPFAPEIGTAVKGDGQATVYFTAPSAVGGVPGNGGNPITAYTVTTFPAGIPAVTKVSSPIIVSGLRGNSPYTFTVTATNMIGKSAPSIASNTVTPTASIPGAPTAVTATPGNGQAIVSFTAPLENGSSIQFYTVTAYPGAIATTGFTSSPVPVTGLANGKAYTFKVTATNWIGTGPSASSPSMTPSTVPFCPANVKAVRGNGQATISFTAPVAVGGVPGNGGSPITSYTVSLDGVISFTKAASPIIVTGLENGTDYTFKVWANNKNGKGDEVTSNAITPAAVPGAPVIEGVQIGNTHVTVLFTAPDIDGGSPITKYTVTSSPGAKTASATSASSGITVTGLRSETAYAFKLTAANAVGTGAASTTTATTMAIAKSAKAVKPEAYPIEVNCLENNVVSIDVLARATGAALVLVSATSPKNGAVMSIGAQYIRYTPNQGFIGSDLFKYTLQDVYGVEVSSTISVKVMPLAWANTPPKAGTVNINLEPGESVIIDADGKVTDKEGGNIRLLSVGTPLHGSVVMDADGFIQYTASAIFKGKDTFTYTVEDSSGAQAMGDIVVSAAAAKPLTYETFEFSMGDVQQPIVNEDAKIEVSTFFKSCGEEGRKSAAMALAQAYVILLQLSGIEADIATAGANADIQARVLKTLGPNYFLATVIQESMFSAAAATKSGFYQLDFTPSAIAWDAACAGPQSFYSNLEFLLHTDRDKVINPMTAKGFCSSSIIAGYYSAITMEALKKSATPMTKFGVNYCMNSPAGVTKEITANIPGTTPLSGGTDKRNYSYVPDTGLMGMLAVFFNRGRSDTSGIRFVTDYVDGKTPFTDKFTYNKDGNDGPAYTGRYIYQIQTSYNTLIANGNSAAANIFQADISAADIVTYINTLDELYPLTVRQAGIDKANTLMQGKKSLAFTSGEFYALFKQVVVAMLEKSKKAWQPVEFALTVENPTLLDPEGKPIKINSELYKNNLMPDINVYSGKYADLARDGNGNITAKPVDTAPIAVSNNRYYLGFTENKTVTLIPAKILGYNYDKEYYVEYAGNPANTWQDAIALTVNATP